MMTTFPLTECATMLAIDPKTLRQWLRQATIPVLVHPTDARLKCLSLEQVQQLATLHDRPVPSPVSAPPARPVAAAAQMQPQFPTHVEPVCEAAQLKTVSTSAPTLPGEAALIEQLAHLETYVTTMQQQLTQLALELLQERELRYEQRLHTLEALIQSPARQEALPPALQTMEGQFQPGERDRQERRVHPAELRARSRVIPLIEYGARGTYVVICPQEGELHLTPDSPEWFDWLATLSSFRFVGRQGRFSAYREHKHRGPTRSWRADRSLHGRNYKHSLGVTDQLSITRLEQVAAILQSHLASCS